jgi:glycosyltransferase involved in cell wall biosynthesis
VRILIAVHGFPPTFYAGAERAAERIVHWLADNGHEVEVFALEQLHAPETRLETTIETTNQGAFKIHRLSYNIDLNHDLRDSYDHPVVGDAFTSVLEKGSFELVHLISGYLLGGQIIHRAHAKQIPVVITLTEYWFFCTRLNLLQSNGALCSGPETDEKCARCLLEEKRRYRLPAQLAPAVMDGFWSIAQQAPFAQAKKQEIAKRRQLLQTALNTADLVISPSHFLISKFKEFGFDTQRYVYIRHGLTPDEQQKTLSRTRTLGDTLRLGFLGQIKPHKGTDLLIDAVLPLLQAGRKLSIDIWGPEHEEPEFAARLRQQTRDFPTIRWNGRYNIADVWKILSDIDVLVIPSRWYENSPTVIAEAFLMGVPVIATRLGGMAEMVEHEKSGLLFELNNAQDLQRQIVRLLDEPAYLNALRAGIPAIKTAEQEVQEIFTQYERLLAAARP